MKSWIKRVTIGLVSLLLLTIAGLFLGRSALLCRVADRKIGQLEQRLGVQIRYEQLRFVSFSEVEMTGLSVVPPGKDTLLRLKQLRLRVDVMPLLQRKLSVRRVYTDGLIVSFVKKNGISNYDCLFRGRSEKSAGNELSQDQPDYSTRVKHLSDAVFRLLPENGELNHTRITGQRDSLITSFCVPSLKIKDNHFHAVIQVAEANWRDCWNVSGFLAHDQRRMEGQLFACEPSGRVALPYIGPHYQAMVAFDSIAFALEEHAGTKGQRVLEGSASVAGLEVFHHRLSPDTILLNCGKLDYRLLVDKQVVTLDSVSKVTFNQLQFHPFVRMSKEGRWHLTASIHKKAFPASQLFASLPVGLFRHVQGLRTDGNLKYDLSVDIDWNSLDSLRFSSDLVGEGFRITDFGNTGLTRMNDEFEYTAYEDDRPVRTFSIGPSNPNFRSLDRISPLLQMAIMQSEDGGFFYHRGFLPGAIQEALAYDLQVGRFARGGSTISMQLVKNIFLNRHKNIARKLEEALLVWLIENQRITTKERMYEVYLNIVEWGPMVYGACEASHFYFDKEPSDLTVNEAIFLASIIPKPKHFRSVFNPDATLKENQEGYFRLLAKRLQVKGVITAEEAEAVSPVIEVKGPARSWLLRTDTLTVLADSVPAR